MSFSFTFSYDTSLSGSAQGQLSSSYTTKLTEYLSGAGADYVAFLALTQDNAITTVEDALALKVLIEGGGFTLSDLFTTAQSTSGSVNIDSPAPKLTVTFNGASVIINLNEMMEGEGTYTWESSVKSGKSATTIYHTREFLTQSVEPAGYEEDWFAPQNSAPVIEDFTWEVNEYDLRADGADTIDSQQWVSFDLLSKASDADNDSLSVVADSVTLDGAPLPSYLKVEGNLLLIDTNSSAFNNLYEGVKDDLTIKYRVTDGVTESDEGTLTIEITGTADQHSWKASANDPAITQTVTMASNDPVNEGLEGVISTSLANKVHADAFDFSGTAIVTVRGDINGSSGNESVLVMIEGNDEDAVFLKPASSGNPEGQSNWVEVEASMQFVSEDDAVSVDYDSTGPVNGGTVTVTISEFDYWL